LAEPTQDSTAKTKEVVAAFNKMAFEDRRPVEAAQKYISATQYIQHNPQGKDGRDSFINGFAAYVVGSEFRCETKRIIAEGDLAVVHALCKDKPSDRGDAVVDIFRVKQGKIVEHWDVVQPIPEKANNTNTMF
jgi:predicted SnoaL-like aldol condensation-catalyzing enzyme